MNLCTYIDRLTKCQQIWRSMPKDYDNICDILQLQSAMPDIDTTRELANIS